MILSIACVCLLATNEPLILPARWEYTAPLIFPEKRTKRPSHAQKDPTIVFYDGKWHLFMTAVLEDMAVIEYCAFEDWDKADGAPRTILEISDAKYYCAPQIFYFTPHKTWYLIYQVRVPDSKFKLVAYSTTKNIDDPKSWTKAKLALDGGEDDPRVEGGLDYWVICDKERAYLFLTTNNGKMWRLWTTIDEFPYGFRDCQLALKGEIFEASHTYKLKGRDQYLTIIEHYGRQRRHYKAYVADRLDGEWKPLADTADRPFAGRNNVQPAPGVEPWTDNISHGELLRVGYEESLTVDPDNLQFLFQGMWQDDKRDKTYAEFVWRLGLLTPVK